MTDRTVLLDGAMGTALQAAGLPAESLPEEWLASRPDAIAAVHAAHARAGAEILFTATFNATAPRLATRPVELPVEALCRKAIAVARAAGPGLRVAGAVGPTGLAGPRRPPPPAGELTDWYTRPFSALAAAGADLLWAESQYDLDEARAALAAARSTGLPAVVTLALAEAGGGLVTPRGEAASDALRVLAAEGASAVGVNCVFLGPALDALARRSARELSVPFVAKPSTGLPGRAVPAAAFGDAAARLAREGARWVGGCCGATADHLAALRTALSEPRAVIL